MFDIKMENKVLYVETVSPARDPGAPRDVLMAILNQESTDNSRMRRVDRYTTFTSAWVTLCTTRSSA